MDPELSRLISEATPKLNPDLAEGLAVKHMRHIAEEVHLMLKASAKGYPSDLRYIDYDIVSPDDEFREIYGRKTKRVMDVARSDLFLIQLNFMFQGHPMPPRYMYLPFVGEAGSITLSASKFFVVPVLSDPGISITAKNVFMRFLRDKVTFDRMGQQYVVEDGGRVYRELVEVVWSQIYHVGSNKLPSKINAKTTLVHYLLCKYGFHEAFQRFGKCTPVIGSSSKINREHYPEKDWVICYSSALTEPKTRRLGNYVRSNLCVAIKRSEWTQQVKNMLGGFFYVLDIFPHKITEEFVNHTRLWHQLMGIILFSENHNMSKSLDQISGHMESLDQYLDEVIMMKLRETGIVANDVYELFSIIIDKFDEWLVTHTQNIGSMYGKELSVCPYILEEVKQAIFNFYFRVKAAYRKENAAPVKMEQILNIMNSTLRTGVIHKIRSGHGEVQTIMYSGDNKAFKITSNIVPQEASSGTKNKNDRAIMEDPSKKLHVSIAEIGNYSALPKSAPDGRSHGNLAMKIDANGMVLRDPELAPMLDATQDMLNRS